MLKGEKINLRLLQKKDVGEYKELFNNQETRGIYFPPMILTEAHLNQRLDKDGHWGDDSMLLVIAEKETDRILGMIVAFKPVPFYAAFEFGYYLFDVASRGKGYTAEAVHLFTAFLFEAKMICRLQLQIEAENKPSLRVAEKCGFQFEGTARCAFFRSGRPIDIGVYSLTRSDWESRREARPFTAPQ